MFLYGISFLLVYLNSGSLTNEFEFNRNVETDE